MKGAESCPRPTRVGALDAFSVHHAAAGLSHLAAVIGEGMIASWGSNEYRQLGGARLPYACHFWAPTCENESRKHNKRQ